MKKILFMKAVTIEGNKHSFPLLKAEKFGRHNVDTGHEVTFKAGEFWGKGKVVTHGKDGCTVADETGREHSVHWNEVSKNHSEKLAKAHVKGFTRKDGSFVREHDDSRTAADFHEHQAVEHYSASTYALRADDEKGEKAHDKAGSAHEKAMRAHKAGDANAAELSAAAKKASDVADSLHDRAKIKSQASSARSASAMKHGDAFSNDNLPKKGTRVTDSYGKKGEVINSTGSQVVIHHDDGATSNNHPTKVFLHNGK